MIELPSFTRHKESPALEARPGIFLAAPVTVSGRGGVLPLYGGFALPKARAAQFDGNILRAVVIVIRGPFPAARSVGEGRLLFADDVTVEQDWVAGHFNLNLFEEFDLIDAPNEYWICASLFEWVSNMVTVKVV